VWVCVWKEAGLWVERSLGVGVGYGVDEDDGIKMQILKADRNDDQGELLVGS